MPNNQGYEREDAYKTLEMINTWINNIDTKVSFALAFSSVLIGFIFSKGVPSVFKRIGEVSKLNELIGGDVIEAIVIVVLYISSIIAIMCFLLAIRGKIKNPNQSQSIFFFGSIASQELIDYRTKTSQMTEQGIIDDLKEQIHTNSAICNKKVKCYNTGIIFLMVTTVLSFICEIFRFI